MSAFQYEMGASKESVDPNSDWYVWLHDPFNVVNGRVSGDVPENGPGYWDLFRTDHDWAKWIGLNAWRINPDWSRIFPRSTEEVKVDVHRDEGIIDIDITERDLEKLDKLANADAVKHYEEIFRDIKEKGMKLIVNLYHWPLPLWIHDPIVARDSFLREGALGWYEERSVVEFAKYVAYVAWKFGGLADMWSTMNEPNVVWMLGYNNLIFPPGVICPEASLRVAINMIEAHARAYDQIKRFTGSDYVGIIYAVTPSEPLTDSEEDRRASEISDYRSTLWYFEAIINGILDTSFGDMFEGEKITRKDLKDKADWIGVNYYSRSVVTSFKEPYFYRVVPNYGFACSPRSKSSDNRPTSDFGWELYPEGIRKAINLVKVYGKPLMITENGVADSRDYIRPWQIPTHLAQVYKAIREDGANVMGYLHWSLIDNLEWAAGFRQRFGLIYVDMETKRRYPRPSAFIYREIVRNNCIPEYLEEYARFPNILV